MRALTVEDTERLLHWLDANGEHIPASVADDLYSAVFFAHTGLAFEAAVNKEFDRAAVARAGEGFDLG